MGAQQAISAADAAEPETWTAENGRSGQPCQLVAAEGDHQPDSEPSDEAIRLRSKEIWQREGCPEGYAEDHWKRARNELAALMEKTSNAQRAEPQADDVAQPEQADTLELEEPAESAEPPASQEEVLCDVVENEQEVLPRQDATISPPNDEPVAVRPPHLRLSPAKRSSAVVPTIICAGIVLRGTLESSGDLQFAGCMEGDIRCAGLAVDDEAVIQGEVVAEEVTVRGRIKGRIRARKVLLCAGSHVEGDILYGTLAIETGAQLDGSFQQQDPLAH